MIPLIFILQDVINPLTSWAQYGILGLVVLGLSSAVVKLYNDNNKLREKTEKLFEEYAELTSELAQAIKEANASQCVAIQRLTEQLQLSQKIDQLLIYRKGKDSE